MFRKKMAILIKIRKFNYESFSSFFIWLINGLYKMLTLKGIFLQTINFDWFGYLNKSKVLRHSI